MGELYKKPGCGDVKFIKCDDCGSETQFFLAIDVWAKIDDKSYCLTCQKNKLNTLKDNGKEREKNN